MIYTGVRVFLTLRKGYESPYCSVGLINGEKLNGGANSRRNG